MTKIPATIVSKVKGELSLELVRTGGCQGCSQQKACAISWQLDDSPVLLNLPRDEQGYRVGDSVLVSCNDKTLLHYVTILFIPTLVFLLTATLLVNHVGRALTLFWVLALQFFLPMVIGFLVSRYGLNTIGRSTPNRFLINVSIDDKTNVS